MIIESQVCPKASKITTKVDDKVDNILSLASYVKWNSKGKGPSVKMSRWTIKTGDTEWYNKLGDHKHATEHAFDITEKMLWKETSSLLAWSWQRESSTWEKSVEKAKV